MRVRVKEAFDVVINGARYAGWAGLDTWLPLEVVTALGESVELIDEPPVRMRKRTRAGETGEEL